MFYYDGSQLIKFQFIFCTLSSIFIFTVLELNLLTRYSHHYRYVYNTYNITRHSLENQTNSCGVFVFLWCTRWRHFNKILSRLPAIILTLIWYVRWSIMYNERYSWPQMFINSISVLITYKNLNLTLYNNNRYNIYLYMQEKRHHTHLIAHLIYE